TAAERPGGWPTRDPESPDIGRKAETAQLVMAGGFTLALAEPAVVGDLQRFLERGVIVARIISHDHRRLMREVLDEVLLAQIGRIHAHLARADLDQALDHEGCLRPPGAAISVDRHGVGV